MLFEHINGHLWEGYFDNGQPKKKDVCKDFGGLLQLYHLEPLVLILTRMQETSIIEILI